MVIDIEEKKIAAGGGGHLGRGQPGLHCKTLKKINKDHRKERKEGKWGRKEKKAQGYSWESRKTASYWQCSFLQLWCAAGLGVRSGLWLPPFWVHRSYIYTAFLQKLLTPGSQTGALDHFVLSKHFNKALWNDSQWPPNWSNSVSTNWRMTKSNSHTVEHI